MAGFRLNNTDYNWFSTEKKKTGFSVNENCNPITLNYSSRNISIDHNEDSSLERQIIGRVNHCYFLYKVQTLFVSLAV